ncbi:MAG TPA: PEGA domain-containing protein [Polyangiales bacterium]|nr:PEGA domain-containing protein [Polyangiales bacterium]
MNMPPMGSNRASGAPLRPGPAGHQGPSRSVLASAAAVAAMIVAAVVAGVSWFGQPDPATLHVTTLPLDCVVAVDGVAVTGTASPYVATELAPDVDHEVEVSRSGYRSWRTRLRLRAGAVVALPEVQLQREGATSTSTLSNPGSSGPTAVPAGRDVVTARAPRPARAAASKPTQGASAVRRPASRVTRPRVQNAPAAELKPAPMAPPAAEPPSARAASASSDADGTLRINSRPWSRVYIDGRLVGNTPQMQLALSPGWHTVTLVNPDFGVQKVLTIRIKPGEIATKIVDLGG